MRSLRAHTLLFSSIVVLCGCYLSHERWIEPCVEGSICERPPLPICVNAIELRTYAEIGTCESARCAYTHSDAVCPGGCDAGRCVAPRCMSGEWTQVTLESHEHTRISALAVDASGALHVSYGGFHSDEPWRTELRYGRRGLDGVWTSSPTSSTTTLRYFFQSIALDTAGGVHVSYYDGTFARLLHTYRSPHGAWNTRTIDDALQGSPSRVGVSEAASALAVDASGGIHVAYHDFGAALRYAYRGLDGSWSITTVDSSGMFPSLAVDASGGVHVTYTGSTDAGNGRLRYAHRSPAGSWAISEVDSDSDITRPTSLVLDPAGGVHISYHMAEFDFQLRYAHRGLDGSWAITTLTDSGLFSGSTSSSLAVDAFGGAHISYSDGDSGELRYAYRATEGSWITTTVDAGGNQHMNAIAVDASFGVHIVYSPADPTLGAREEDGDLRYAYRPGCL